MLFKFITLATAFASIVSGSPVSLEARQTGQLATCTIRTTPSSTPNGGPLLDEFIIIFNREYAADIPPNTSIITGSTTFTGPSGGVYTVVKALGAATLTAEQTRDIMRAWAGQTFAGGGRVGVTSWLINSVVC